MNSDTKPNKQSLIHDVSDCFSNATHKLKCKHCVGKNCSHYYMYCIPKGLTKSGKMKVLVFGERNWKNKEHLQNIRYVDVSRISLK